jgi:hypothetical protein
MVSFLVLVVVSVVVMAAGTGCLVGGDLLEVCPRRGELDGWEGVPDNVHRGFVCGGCGGDVS